MSHDFSLGTVEVALSPLERFEEFVATRGKRRSSQRRLIVEQVFSRHDHFDADDLLAQLREVVRDRKVSRATVYRTLSELVEAGLLREMDLKGRKVYEHDYGYPQHEHLRCGECGKMIEFQSPVIEAAMREVCRQHHFNATGHTFVIRGTCAECNRARVTKRRLDLI